MLSTKLENDRYIGFLLRHAVRIQGIFYFISGVWPLLSTATFQMVTGPKTDIWLVKTVGLFLMLIGSIIIIADYRRQIDWTIVALGIGSACILTLVELTYVFSGTISMVYLLDAFVEIFFIFAWIQKKNF